MSEVVAMRGAASAAVRAEDGDLRFGLGLAVALTALALMLLPAAVGIWVLVGVGR